MTIGPDFDLLHHLVGMSSVPVLAEGRITTPDEAARALSLGAHAVVVGSAITHPTSITRRFAAVVTGPGTLLNNTPSSSH
jgi:N-acylglucosamine-6-phosphate 2-epimerase